MENNITFDKLPQAVAQLLDEVSQIKRLITEKVNPTESIGDQLLTIQEAAELLHLSVPTCYGLVHQKEVPVCKKGKRLYFPKQELIEWIKTGRKQTAKELTSEALDKFHAANKSLPKTK